MNGPAGPPPPPPPPPFIVPGATPPVMAEAAPSLSRAPSKGTAPQLPPQVAPPAALAGAMMKDKKPFTYTPGGLDLSEISPAPNGAPPVPEGPPMQSRSFRLLQNVVDGEASDPQGPVHIPLIKSQQPQPRQQGGGSSGAIPSRAFRALQQHTDAQQDGAGEARSSASPPQPMSTSPSPSPSSFPSSTSSSHLATHPSDGRGQSFANYSQPASVPLYRNVAPQIVLHDGTKHKNVVNSALTKQREASPARPWHSNSSRSESPVNTPAANSNNDQSRLLKFISQEVADNANRNGLEVAEPKKLYGGAKIPSRVFKQLQTDYSESSDMPDMKTQTSYGNTSPVGGDKPKLSAGLLRLLQSDYNKLQNDRSPSDVENNSVISSSYGELEEYFNNGMMNTAATKEHVLKELTTQFDPVTERRKPRAAPGRVFRYLQQQYDEPESTEIPTRPAYSNGNYGSRNNSISGSTNGQRNHSPSFNFLQSKYSIDADNSANVSEDQTSDNSGEEVDNLNSLHITEGGPVHSKPYSGNRIPGRTFRMLQENYSTHPSVLQARK